VIHPGSLGDVLLSLPALREVRRRFGAGELVLLAKKEVGEFLSACGEVDRVFAVEGQVLSGLMSDGGTLPLGVQRWFDRQRPSVVAWMSDLDGKLEAMLRSLECRRVIIRSPTDEGIRATHQADRFLETLGIEGTASAIPPVLTLPPRIRQQGAELLSGLIGSSPNPILLVHPGSGSRFKCVRPGVLVHLSNALSVDGVTMVLIEGPADAESTAEVHQLDSRIPVLRNLSLEDLAGVLGQADLLVGHDSGLSHLAAALGVPTVAIFGPTDPARWAPLGRHVSVLRGGLCHCVTWAMVGQCTGRPCLEIDLDHLVQLCRMALARTRPHPAARPQALSPLSRYVTVREYFFFILCRLTREFRGAGCRARRGQSRDS
jgi:ADP-heptose:LPS heptosyltransferase